VPPLQTGNPSGEDVLADSSQDVEADDARGNEDDKDERKFEKEGDRQGEPDEKAEVFGSAEKRRDVELTGQAQGEQAIGYGRPLRRRTPPGSGVRASEEGRVREAAERRQRQRQEK